MLRALKLAASARCSAQIPQRSSDTSTIRCNRSAAASDRCSAEARLSRRELLSPTRKTSKIDGCSGAKMAQHYQPIETWAVPTVVRSESRRLECLLGSQRERALPNSTRPHRARPGWAGPTRARRASGAPGAAAVRPEADPARPAGGRRGPIRPAVTPSRLQAAGWTCTPEKHPAGPTRARRASGAARPARRWRREWQNLIP